MICQLQNGTNRRLQHRAAVLCGCLPGCLSSCLSAWLCVLFPGSRLPDRGSSSLSRLPARPPAPRRLELVSWHIPSEAMPGICIHTHTRGQAQMHMCTRAPEHAKPKCTHAYTLFQPCLSVCVYISICVCQCVCVHHYQYMCGSSVSNMPTVSLVALPCVWLMGTLIPRRLHQHCSS